MVTVCVNFGHSFLCWLGCWAMSLSITRHPENVLDPPEPPEPSEDEKRERRAAALRGLTNREILEAIGDSNELASAIWIQIVMLEASGYVAGPMDNQLLGERIREVVVPLLDRYVGE